MEKPKKKPGRETTTLTVGMTVAERQAIERAARAAGMSIDQYVKNCTIPPEAEKPFTLIPPDIWRGLFPADLDLDKEIHEIRTEWEKEWDESGNFVG